MIYQSFSSYLDHIGISSQEGTLSTVDDSIVHTVYTQAAKVKQQMIEKLYLFDVPKLGPNGSCSLVHEKEEKPYNLAETVGIVYEPKKLVSHPYTLHLWRLRQIVDRLQKQTGVDWLGIYRKITKKNGDVILLKESYYGRRSRPEFPLTEEFAKGSNNSTVGLTGKAVVVDDVASYAGPYYECDTEVRSEFCCPILDSNGNVAGIIDAEAFAPHFFTQERLFQVAKVCFDLGSRKEFTGLV